MTVGSLCAGIGGFELAAVHSGLQVKWSNDIDPFCCQILRKNFNHKVYECDLKELRDPPTVDIVCAGFPCQPFSKAGLRKGKEDDRFIWPKIIRLIRELRPTYVLCENVANLSNMENGQTLLNIFSSLEDEAYEIESFDIPAGGLAASHLRERIWFVAYSNKKREIKDQHVPQKGSGRSPDLQKGGQNGQRSADNYIGLSSLSFATLKDLYPWWQTEFESFRICPDKGGLFARYRGDQAQDLPIIPGEHARLSSRMDRSGNKRRQVLGNTIQPQIATVFFEAIKEHHKQLNH